MRIFHKFLMGAAVVVLSAQTAFATSLTHAEQSVCTSLRQCLDIVSRHDASEFDYTVLTQEFRRFGPKGRSALFEILARDAETSDVAEMIAALGPLTSEENRRVDQIWSGPLAINVAPLVQDMTLVNRDRWIAGLEHPDPKVSAVSQRVFRLPPPLSAAPLTPEQTSILLADMSDKPSPLNIAILSHMSAHGQEAGMAQLLHTGYDATIMRTAYEALYRESPARAFEHLLNAMRNVETGSQIAQLGNMLAAHQAGRGDGFYAKVAADISGDGTFPVQARAVGLHGWLFSMTDERSSSERPSAPDMTAERLEAFDALLMTGAADIPKYTKALNGLEAAAGQPLLDRLWAWVSVNRHEDRALVLKAAMRTPLEKQALTNGLRSDDRDLVLAALRLAQDRAEHSSEIAHLFDHPVIDIAVASRLAAQGQFVSPHMDKTFHRLKDVALAEAPSCEFASFDVDDLVVQMPFFDTYPVKTDEPWVRLVSRKALNAAHPTASGWLAAYYLRAQGGGLVYFDTKTGEGRRIGTFRSPLAILPNHPLKLGEVATSFWIVDTAGHLGPTQSLFRLTQIETGFNMQRVTTLPESPTLTGLAPNGDVLVSFTRPDNRPVQPPLRFSPDGRVSSACTQISN